MVAFGSSETFTGWANGVTSGSRSKFSEFVENAKDAFKEEGEFSKSEYDYDEDSEAPRRKYDKKTRKFHDEPEPEPTGRNKGRKNVNEKRQEKIKEDFQNREDERAKPYLVRLESIDEGGHFS